VVIRGRMGGVGIVSDHDDGLPEFAVQAKAAGTSWADTASRLPVAVGEDEVGVGDKGATCDARSWPPESWRGGRAGRRTHSSSARRA
jgi:hypothetical protein